MIQKYGLNERKEIQEEDSEVKVITSEQHEKKTEINVNGISEEEQKQFMDIFCRIYRNLADMK